MGKNLSLSLKKKRKENMNILDFHTWQRVVTGTEEGNAAVQVGKRSLDDKSIH